MKRPVENYDTPPRILVGKTLALDFKSAELDQRGGVTALVQVWKGRLVRREVDGEPLDEFDGKLIEELTVPLANQSGRRRFIEAIRVRLPKVPSDKLEEALANAQGQLSDRLQKRADEEAAAKRARKATQEKEPDYAETDGGLVWRRPHELSSWAVEEVPLTNFRARIVAEVVEEDGLPKDCGAPPPRFFEIEARLHGPPVSARIPAAEFEPMRWVALHLGAEFIVWAGSGTRDHARAAIQFCSGIIERHTVYTHLGWTQIAEHGWVFLHAGGAIGAAGPVDGIEVRPPRDLESYRLPGPPSLDSAREAVRCSLDGRLIGPARQLWPIKAAVYLAPLGEAIELDFTVWNAGDSGAQKSTCCLLELNHFGRFRDDRDIPANFTSSANSLEELLFSAKDVVLLVDDYHPNTDPRTAAQQEEAATRLIRSTGNSQGRNRMTRDRRIVGERPPRTLPMATAEKAPPGMESSEARVLEAEWAKGSVDLEKLTAAQAKNPPLYAAAMAGYVQWLASRMDRLIADLRGRVRADASRISKEGVWHGRVADTAAKLLVGTETFLTYGLEIAAITQGEFDALMEEARSSILFSALRTCRHILGRRPSAVALSSLATLLRQGHVFVAALDGYAPPAQTARQWGWRLERTDDGCERARTIVNAEKLGWVDEGAGFVYLLPEALHRVVSEYARRSGSAFPVTRRELGENLNRDGRLAQTGKERIDYHATAEGGRHWCWVIRIADLYPAGEDTQDGDEGGADDEKTPDSQARDCGNLVPANPSKNGSLLSSGEADAKDCNSARDGTQAQKSGSSVSKVSKVSSNKYTYSARESDEAPRVFTPPIGLSATATLDTFDTADWTARSVAELLDTARENGAELLLRDGALCIGGDDELPPDLLRELQRREEIVVEILKTANTRNAGGTLLDVDTNDDAPSPWR